MGASRTPSRLCVTWSTLLATSLLDIQSTYPRWQPPTATHTRSSDTSWEVPSASETSATLLSAPGTGLLDFLLCCSSLLSISSVYFGSALRLMWRFLLSDYGKVVVQAVIVAEISRIQMQGVCPAAVGMGQVATLSRAQYLRGAPQDLPLLTHTSHILWVRTTAPLSHFAFNSIVWKLTNSPLCVQAPVKVPSRFSRVWCGTLPPGPPWRAIRHHTAMAAAATPRFAPPPPAWSPVDVPLPASCLYARSLHLCSSGWAPPLIPLALRPPSPATAYLPANATHWLAYWAMMASATLWQTPSASTITIINTYSNTTPLSPQYGEMTSPTECRFVNTLFCVSTTAKKVLI